MRKKFFIISLIMIVLVCLAGVNGMLSCSADSTVILPVEAPDEDDDTLGDQGIVVDDPQPASAQASQASQQKGIWTRIADAKKGMPDSIRGLNGQLMALYFSDNKIEVSKDGKTWNTVTVTNDKNVDLFDIAFGAGYYVAVGSIYSSGVVYISKDGIAWTQAAAPPCKILSSVTYSGSKFVAVGAVSATGASIIASNDGVNWYAVDNPSASSEYYTSVVSAEIADKETFIISVLQNKYVFMSSDLKNWTKKDLPQFTCSVVSGNDILAALGAGTNIRISYDGDNWTDHDVGAALGVINFEGGRFIVTTWNFIEGRKIDNILISEDGMNWTKVEQDGKYATFRSFGYANNRYYTMAESTILASPEMSTAGSTVNDNIRGFTATPDNGYVNLKWTEVTDKAGLDGYYIYRGTTVGGESKYPLNDFPATGLEYKDTEVQNGTVYYYIVKPSYNNGQRIGAASAEASAKPISTAAAGSNKMILVIGNPNMTVNGVSMEIDPGKGTAPVLKDGKTFVPIRAIVEQMGGNIAWDNAEQKITINLGSKKVELWLNKKTAKVNGVSEELPAAPYTSATGRTMIPLRFVAESLGCSIDFNGATNTITITYELTATVSPVIQTATTTPAQLATTPSTTAVTVPQQPAATPNTPAAATPSQPATLPTATANTTTTNSSNNTESLVGSWSYRLDAGSTGKSLGELRFNTDGTFQQVAAVVFNRIKISDFIYTDGHAEAACYKGKYKITGTNKVLMYDMTKQITEENTKSNGSLTDIITLITAKDIPVKDREYTYTIDKATGMLTFETVDGDKNNRDIWIFSKVDCSGWSKVEKLDVLKADQE